MASIEFPTDVHRQLFGIVSYVPCRNTTRAIQLYILAVAAMNLLWWQSKKRREYESDTSKFYMVSELIANLDAKLNAR